jgi:L-ascorbate metabolism protein UlaG (beta-lactamase superfamily)
MKEKTILGSFGVLVVIALVVQYSGILSSPSSPETGQITVTLLKNAGIMIETGDKRIYIDPIDLPEEYRDKPADAVLITHDHSDHYQITSIEKIQKEDTVNVFPEIMRTAINLFDGVGVAPGDVFMVGDIKVTAFYMYTFSPDGSTPASHPIESHYTSYIVDIGDFRIFHAGDSKNIPEYIQLTDTIDVACLPLGPGCQTMCNDEVVDVVKVIKPSYMIPIHYTAESYNTFDRIYKRQVEPDCAVCSLPEFTSYTFETG